MTLAAGVIVLICAAVAAAEGTRKLGTIGPPPRKDPQRMTSAEGVPPLPLPATPLRRSEPKAEPSPPLFIARLAYGDVQDYMPNPGDIDNLLRHVRAQLDAWYGHKIVSIDEVATVQAGGEIYDVPMLYITGYQPFDLTQRQREALREYLLNGGTLLADATLGSPAFGESFVREVKTMFPDRKFDTLPLDHPIYRAYFNYANVNYYAIEKGVNTPVESPPRLMGMNLAARTAVIFSPFDMTCGWDGFHAPPSTARVGHAPRSMAMMPRDAVRMGINIVAYSAAMRRFARAQATTRQIVGDQPPRRDAMPIGLLRHQGDWNADPNSLQQLMRLAAQQTSVPMAFEIRPVEARIDQLADITILVMSGMDDPGLSDAEVAVLRRHVQAGGFLLINNTSGYTTFDREARDLIKRILPDQALQPVPADHALMSSLYAIGEVARTSGTASRTPSLEAVTLDGRAAIVYSPDDMLAMLKGVHDPYANAYDTDSSRKLAMNVLCYAMKR